MNRCSSEDFYFDPKNNIYAIQVSDAFDTSQAMDLRDTFNSINKSNAVCTRKFNIRLGDLIVNKPDWLTRYKELCNIPVPCLVLTTGGVTEETMTNLVNMFLNSRTPGIYLCNRYVFGHIHRKAEAMELRSTVVPIEMNNQVYYRFTDKSIYGFTYGTALFLIFNPFIPILTEDEMQRNPKSLSYVRINKDKYANYKKEIVMRINMYTMLLNFQLDLFLSQLNNGVMCGNVSLFLNSGWTLFVGTPADYQLSQTYNAIPFKCTDDGIIVRKTRQELEDENLAKIRYKHRYDIANRRVQILKEIIKGTHWGGATYMGLSSNYTFEDKFDEDNSYYEFWLNSNDRNLKTGWWFEKDWIDLINNRGEIATSWGLCSYWARQLEQLSGGAYKVLNMVCKEGTQHPLDSSAKYKVQMQTPNGKQELSSDKLEELAKQLGYTQEDFTVEKLNKLVAKDNSFLQRMFKIK